MRSKLVMCITLLIILGVGIQIQAAAKSEEIPVTTSSKEAMDLFAKGQKFLDVGRPQEANKIFRDAVGRDRSFSYAYTRIANSAASAEEFKENLDLAMQNIAGKSEGEKLIIEINRTFIDNDAQKRIDLSKQLVAKYPNSSRAWLLLGNMQGTINHHGEARKSIGKALELNPKLTAAHFALGFSYLFSVPKDFNMAKQHMEHCIQLEPSEAKAHEGLGDVYRALKELEKARQAYTTALERDPSLSVVSLKKGHINSFLGNFAEARSDYDKGVAGAVDANKIFYANYRAFAHLHEGSPKAALDELGKLVASADSVGIPDDQVNGAKIFTLTNEITIALHHNMFAEAENILQQLRTVTKQNNERVADPDFARQQNANVLLFEGQLAARKGDYATAKAKAEENRKLMEGDSNPRKLEGYNGLLGLVAFLEKNYPQAVDAYKKADLTVMYNKYYLALAQDGAGNKGEAKKLFKEVGEWNFNSVDFALVRKDALRRMA